MYMYILSAISFGLSLHSNDTPKIFLPIFIPVLIIYDWKALIKTKKQIVVFLIILAFFYALMLKVLFLDNQISDFNRVSILNSSSISNLVDNQREFTNAPLWLSGIFHNKFTVLSQQYLSNYFKVFSISWFFADGPGSLGESMGRNGQFYMFEIPFFFIGMALAFKKMKIGMLLILWLLIANIPGAITTGENYPYRSILMLPIPIIFSSLGIVWCWSFFSKKKYYPLSVLLKAAFVVVVVFYVSSFLFVYFFDYPVYGSESRFKERNEVINYAAFNSSAFDKVFFNGGAEWAVMYAFNNKVQPEIFQQAYKNKIKYKGIDALHIGKFYFGSFSINYISTPSAFFPKNSIFISDGDAYPDAQYIKSFLGPDKLKSVYKVFVIK